jgi:hypothetical protein
VGGQHDRLAAAADLPDDVLPAALDRLDPPARQPVAQPLGELARLRRAGRARAELDLVAQVGERPVAVEAVDV